MSQSQNGGGASGVTRRGFLKGAGVAAGGLAATGTLAGEALAAGAQSDVTRISGKVKLELVVNGAKQKMVVEPRTTLLSALRHRVEPALTGTKIVCDHGNCGACTVLMDGEPVCSCVTLAVQAEGHEIRTVEGLADGDQLSPLQEAFVEHDAMMCGFCTPGFLMSLTGCLEKNPTADEMEIRSACSGNTCRCGTYPNVFAAAKSAGERMAKGGGK